MALHAQSGRRFGRAMTLVELLITLVISAMVAAAATSILFATTQAVDSRNDVRQAVVRSNTVDARLRNEIHTSLAFLAAGTDELVLWAADDNDNGAVNLDEIVLIQRNSSNQQLRRYRVAWPAGWSQAQIDAANVTYAPSSNFSQIANNAKSTGYFPGVLWSSKAGILSIVLDAASAQAARVVTIRMTITTDGEDYSFVVVGSIRAPLTPGTE